MIRILGYEVRFSQDEMKPYQSLFRVLTEADINEDPGNPDDFFKGINQSLGAFKKGWDFQRDVYASVKGIKSVITQELTKSHPRQNQVRLITGIPGIGKSMVIRRLAYDFYLVGVPIVIFNQTKTKFDFKVLDSLLMDIDRKLSESTKGKIRNTKSIVIFDDIASLMIDPVEVATYLSSRGRAALIVCSSRDINLESGPPFGIPESTVISIPQRLTSDEAHRLVNHLNQLGYVASVEVWEDFVKEQLQGSFCRNVHVSGSCQKTFGKNNTRSIHRIYDRAKEDVYGDFCFSSIQPTNKS